MNTDAVMVMMVLSLIRQEEKDAYTCRGRTMTVRKSIKTMVSTAVVVVVVVVVVGTMRMRVAVDDDDDDDAEEADTAATDDGAAVMILTAAATLKLVMEISEML